MDTFLGGGGVSPANLEFENENECGVCCALFSFLFGFLYLHVSSLNVLEELGMN